MPIAQRRGRSLPGENSGVMIAGVARKIQSVIMRPGFQSELAISLKKRFGGN
jgi:hypothetical protein